MGQKTPGFFRKARGVIRYSKQPESPSTENFCQKNREHGMPTRQFKVVALSFT